MWLLLKGLAFTRTGMIALAVMAALGWRAYDVHHQRQIGASRAVEKIEKQTEKINDKAQKARTAARRPGAAQRVRERYCRDC